MFLKASVKVKSGLLANHNVSLLNSLSDLLFKCDIDLLNLLFIFGIKPSIIHFTVNAVYPYLHVTAC